MHRSGAPYSVRELYYTWLVLRTRASYKGVDDSNSGEWIHLKRGVDRRGCGPIALRGHRIILCGGVWPPSGDCFVIERSYGVWLVLTTRCWNLVPMASFWGSGLCPWSPTIALHVLLNLGRRSCADVLIRSDFPAALENLILARDGQGPSKRLKFLARSFGFNLPKGHMSIVKTLKMIVQETSGKTVASRTIAGNNVGIDLKPQVVAPSFLKLQTIASPVSSGVYKIGVMQTIQPCTSANLMIPYYDKAILWSFGGVECMLNGD
ncbi:hypothetical protein M9H77_12902 [Catharanthus roseus]|uniref:Uncharacterized protein n=1 Tax=Catharanthus roseus TaxID=4058 RepID=A0ACC0BIW0_CATRO|nr:hypothetical protein M9H77_12902 [Catharanthus roseus]